MSDYDEQQESRTSQKMKEAGKQVAGTAMKQGAKAAGKMVFNAGKTALVKVGAAILSAISLKALIIIGVIVGIVCVFIFFSIEAQKAFAAEAWTVWVDDIERTDENFVAKGYRSMGGLTEDKYQEILKFVDTGELPIDENLPAEEKEKLEFENKQRKINLKEVSTDQERERIKKYMEADRDSTLRSMEEETFFGKLLDLFNEADIMDEEKPKPTMEFVNHDQDFKKLKEKIRQYTHVPDPITSPLDYAEYIAKLNALVGGIEGRLNGIKSEVKADHDKMKDYSEVKLTGGSGSSTRTSIDSIRVETIEHQDELFRLIDPYALSWKVLYLIDKAIDEAEFDDFKDLSAYDPASQTSKEALIESIKTQFIRQAIPRFIPLFKVERHLKIKIETEDWSSWPPDDCEDCDGDSGASLDIEVTPVYRLVKVDAWNQLLVVPSGEREIEEKEYERKDNDNGSGHQETVITYTYEPIDAPGSDSHNEIPFKKETERVSNGERTKGYGYSEDITRNKNKDGGYDQKVTKAKEDEVKEVFVKIYGEKGYNKIKFDVEHMLYLTTGMPSIARARCDVAVAFGLSEALNKNAALLRGILGQSQDGNVNINGVDLIMGTITPLDQVNGNVTEAIDRLSAKYGADVNLIRAIVWRESNFNPKINGDGLMQISGIKQKYNVTDATDIEQNLNAGIQYIMEQINSPLAAGDVRVALVMYNYGPGATEALGKTWEEIYPKIPLRNDIPDKPEVHQVYPREVLGAYVQYRQLYPGSGTGVGGGSGLMQDSDGTALPEGPVEALHWDEVRKILPSSQGAKIECIDVQTSKRYFVMRYGGSNHADVVPASAQDKAIMDSMINNIAHNNGDRWTYRPTIVIIDNRKIAAARHSMPHGHGIPGHNPGFTVDNPNGYTSDNENIDTEGEEGHCCIHFLGSRTHINGGQVRPDAQRAVGVAAGSNLDYALNYSGGLLMSDYCYGSESGMGCIGDGCVGTNPNSAKPIILDDVSFPLNVTDPQKISDSMGGSSWYGRRKKPCNECSDQHHGVDLPGGAGTLVLAFAAGKVVEVERSSKVGGIIVIEHPELNLKTRYLHLGRFYVTQGQEVKEGDAISVVGNTQEMGTQSTGPHLHFEVYNPSNTVDPCIYLKKFGSFDGHNVL